MVIITVLLSSVVDLHNQKVLKQDIKGREICSHNLKAGGLLWCLLGCIMSTAEEPTVGNLGTVITSTWTCWVTFYAVSLSVSITFSVKQISGLYALRGLGGDNGKGAASHPALLPYQCKGAWISCWTVNQPDDRPNPSFTREEIPAGNQSDTFPM